MRTQTKCTFVICGLFIIELLPVPFSALYSLYAIRKRPDWLPLVVEQLYADKPVKKDETIEQLIPTGHDPMVIRKKCTINLAILFVIDLLIPVIIPTALFVVRRRPIWFKNLVVKLYSDKLQSAAPKPDETPALNNETPELLEKLEQKLAALESENIAFARSLSARMINSKLDLR